MTLTRRSIIQGAGAAGSLLLVDGLPLWAQAEQPAGEPAPPDYLRLSSALLGVEAARLEPPARGDEAPLADTFHGLCRAAARVWARLGAADNTVTRAGAPTGFRYDGQDYNYQGAGHICGTHVMGSAPGRSVVNPWQRTWDHPNLYLAGCGSMPSVGTQNPTLTMLAVSCRTVDDILARLR